MSTDTKTNPAAQVNVASKPAPEKAAAKPGPEEWHVLVRHSTLRLKSLYLTCLREHAQERFLQEAKKLHDEKAAEALERDSGEAGKAAAKGNKDAWRHAYEHRNEMEWVIRPAAEARAEEKRLEEQQKAVLEGRTLSRGTVKALAERLGIEAEQLEEELEAVGA